MYEKIVSWLTTLTDLYSPTTLKPTHFKSICNCVDFILTNSPHGSELKTLAKPLYNRLKLTTDGCIDEITKNQITALFDMAVIGLNSKNNSTLKADSNTANIFTKMLSKYNYLIITDLEMTCIKQRGTNFRSETIEIGCAAVDATTLEIVDTFSMLVNPVINHTLSPFCTSLTHISQQDVDSAEKYEVVANALSRWLSNFHNAAFVAWGAGDHKQLNIDAKHHNIKSPIYGMPTINLKQLFKNLGFVKRDFGLKKALNIVGVEQGDAHRALPDAINTAKLLPFMRQNALTALNSQLTAKQVESHGRLLTLILRHMPSKAFVEVDEQGWCDIAALVKGLDNHSRHPLTTELIMEICFRDDGCRFQISPDESKIRCLQGHSLPHVKINFLPVYPSTPIYHGTSEKNLLAIKQSGEISKMNRNFVHLTNDVKKAFYSGKRHGEPVVLQIDTESMIRDGYCLFISDNGVYLTNNIPSMYLCKKTLNQ